MTEVPNQDAAPADRPTDPPRKLLVLDLDETLVFATRTPLDRSPEFQVGPYGVYRRPGLLEFLRACQSIFDVAVWTSSSRDYAEGVVTELFKGLPPPVFVWSRERCTQRSDGETHEHFWLKDLAKLKRKGYSLEQVIVVDDTAAKLFRTYGNLVCVRSWEGDLNDRELPVLQKYLETLATVSNVRTIDKRGWRQHRPLG